MHASPRRLAALVFATSLVAALATGSAASGGDGAGRGGDHEGRSVKLVVNTQFESETSPVVKATGPFRSCTSVQDLHGDVVDLGYTLAFYGIKEITCARGDVIISYGAILSTRRENATYGSWDILVSTLPGVTSGGGRLYGDPDRCVDLSGDEGCILDVFRGRVH